MSNQGQNPNDINKYRSQVFTFANAVTFLRLILIFVFLWLMFAGDYDLAFFVFVVAWALDVVDGWLARLLNQATKFGSVFDKGVDRLLLILGILVFIKVEIIPPYAILLLVKDISALPILTIHAKAREQMSNMGYWGKMAVVLQGLGLVWLVVGLPAPMIVVGIIAVLGGLVSMRHLWQVVYDHR